MIKGMKLQQDIQIGNFKYLIDIDKEVSKRKFKCLLNYDIYEEDFIKVKDIYIIDNELIQNKKTSHLVYPINNMFNTYSNNMLDFDNDMYTNNIYDYLVDLSYDSVPCDLVKIYHPHNKANLDYIISISSNVNGINIYFICTDAQYLETDAKEEIIKSNIIYSEYKYCYIPSLYKILCEDLISINIDFLSKTLTYRDIFFPKYILKTDSGNREVIVEDNILKYIYNTSLAVQIYPYSSISNNKYIADNQLQPNIEIFRHNVDLSLKINIGYDKDCKISLIGKFEYGDITDEKEVQELYLLLNDIKIDDYVRINNELDKNYVDDDGKKVNFIYYNIGVASDVKFNNMIYTNDLQYSVPEDISDWSPINNFIVPISDIFNSWDQLPDLICCQVVFQDKFTGFQIPSNQVQITKEDFKFYYKNNEGKRYIDMREVKTLQLVDKATCYINNSKEESNQVSNISNVNAQQKYIIKPVFYRTQDLQQIQIKSGIAQNIGINLIDYMTKVSSFKLKFDNYVINEYARNDMFVIFSINANLINNSTGNYNIFNQDDEYISSGKYIVI